MSRSPAYSPRFVLSLSLAQLITWGSVFYTFALLVGPLEKELGMSRAESSLAFSLALLTEGLLAWPVGRWIQRGFERRVMTIGSVVVGLGLLWHSQIHSPLAFYAVWIFLGAGLAATLYSPVFAVVTQRFPNDFRRAIITITFLGGLASTVFIPLTAWLIDAMGWRHALLCLAALQFLVCVPLHALTLRSLAPDARHAHRPTEHAAVLPRTLQQHLKSAPFLLIGLFTVVMMAVTAALPAHMVSLLQESGLSPFWVILVPASIGVLQVLGRVLLFLFEHRIDLHRSNRWIAALIPAGLLVLLAAPWLGSAQTAVVLVFVVLFGMGNGMLTIVKGTAIAQYVDREQVAALNGALGLPTALARAAAPWGLGLLWSPTGGYTSGLWLLAGLGVVGVVALTLAQRQSLHQAR